MIEHENIKRLNYGDKEITLIGTAHVSQESADLVRQVIEMEKPDTVCIELCDSRYESIQQEKTWKDMDIVKVIREKKMVILLVNFLLSSYQRKMAKDLGIKPGQEMLEAIKVADENECSVEVIDRDVRVTLSRIVNMIGFWTKMKLFSHVVFSSFSELFEEDPFKGLSEEERKEKVREQIESLKTHGSLEFMVDEFGEALPDIKKRLIDERDLFMNVKLRESEGKKIVAVVGAGHVPGMLKNWDNEEIDMNQLNTIPPKSSWGTVIKVLISLLLCAILIGGFFRGDGDVGKGNLMIWVVVNGVLAGIGALIAKAHPLTALAAAIVAPFASLNPMVGTGQVAAFIEAVLKKPKVKDFEGLQDDILTREGWWKNQVTRVLLVFFFVSMGSLFGSLIGAALMAGNL